MFLLLLGIFTGVFWVNRCYFGNGKSKFEAREQRFEDHYNNIISYILVAELFECDWRDTSFLFLLVISCYLCLGLVDF